MFLQGDLQSLFDALYHIGAIDPVLKADWETINQEMMRNPNEMSSVFAEINSCRGDIEALVHKLKSMDQKMVHYIALEVAREFVEFKDRSSLH